MILKNINNTMKLLDWIENIRGIVNFFPGKRIGKIFNDFLDICNNVLIDNLSTEDKARITANKNIEVCEDQFYEVEILFKDVLGSIDSDFSRLKKYNDIMLDILKEKVLIML